MDRKQFIQTSLALTGLAGIASCTNKQSVKGRIEGASADIGHLLREKKFNEPDEHVTAKVVIIGGGISGLSAARRLTQRGIDDVLLLDLESKTGGNAAGGSNEVSSYPRGAHYIPIPNNDLTEYMMFLRDAGVITGEQNGLPVYNEFYLCADPEERLYINGKWQEGIIPQFGLNDNDKKEIQSFLATMDSFRHAKGKDGKYAFNIPVDTSSKDEQFTVADNITMKQWLSGQNYTSPYLHWYVNYCTRDDFGTEYDRISAWCGIHYFAARKGTAANANYHDVITWPEGNAWLADQLTRQSTASVRTGTLAVSVESQTNNVIIKYLDIASRKLIAVTADHCILAVPQFVARRLLNQPAFTQTVQQHLHYTPWMTANLKVRTLSERSGAPLSWDNVVYGSESLGYVEATHQLTDQFVPVKNLTYYLPLTKKDAATERKLASERSHAQWVQMIFNDLRKIHPDIEEKTEEVNITVWGHAMAQPLPGMIHGDIRSRLAEAPGERIHFAHTDLAGISIFEEAFYQGIHAADKIISHAE